MPALRKTDCSIAKKLDISNVNEDKVLHVPVILINYKQKQSLRL